MEAGTGSGRGLGSRGLARPWLRVWIAVLGGLALSGFAAAPGASAAAGHSSAPGQAADAPPAAGVAPGAYTSGAARFIVYTGTGGGVWQKTVGSAAPAVSLGGRLISAPSPISAGGTRIVFGEGTDRALWERVGNGAWRRLGGTLTSKPGAVAGESASSYRVYVRGSNGAVWARNHTASGWGAWYTLGGSVLSGTGPSAAHFGGWFEVLVVGTNRALFLRPYPLTFWLPLGGITTSSPAIVNAWPSSGSMVAFARGTNNAGYFNRIFDDRWVSMGGRLTSGMGGSATGANWFAYGHGTDTQVWEHAGIRGATGSWTRRTP